jgi:L-iditol 2-dehydrogenase
MKQAVMTAPGQIQFRDVEKPTPKDNEVILQTRRIGVCGSDIHVYHGMHPYTSFPVVQGHEVGGGVGSHGVTDKVGDKITFMPQVTCGKCIRVHGMYHLRSLK